MNKESEKLWLEFFKLEAILARSEATDGVEVVVDVDKEVASKYKDEKAQLDLYAIPMLIYKQVTLGKHIYEHTGIQSFCLYVFAYLTQSKSSFI